MGLTLNGKRDFSAWVANDRSGPVSERKCLMRRGSLYVSSPSFFKHAVQNFDTYDEKDASLCVMFRFAFLDKIAADAFDGKRDDESLKAAEVVHGVLSEPGLTLLIPSYEEVCDVM